jgi:hypothetical protein
LDWIGKYIVHKKPDVIVQIGDFADMESLCSYDKGKRSFEGRRYKSDVDAAYEGMSRLLRPMDQYNAMQCRNKKKEYRPRMVLTLGNHEQRINTATELDPMLEGLLKVEDLNYEAFGWEVHPFLKPVTIDGVTYAHYFPTGVMGRPASTAAAILSNYHKTCVAGHQQGRNYAQGKRSPISAIIAGSCYQHDEAYLNPMTNEHWRGVIMLHEVVNGTFDEMFVSLRYLKRKYG